MPTYRIQCPECGEERGFLQDKCPACGSTQVIGEFEKALAEFEAITPRFGFLFNREFAGASK